MKTIEKEAKQVAWQIGQRIKDPEKVVGVLLSENNHFSPMKLNPWEPTTLSHGFPAFICLFSELEEYFPGEGWELVCRQHILKLIEHLEKNGVHNVSMFSGMTGICFAINQASKNKQRYQTLLSKLEDLLLKKITSDYLKENFVPSLPHQYDLISGMSGIIPYLIQSTAPRSFVQQLCKNLLKVTENISFENYSIPGWYVPVNIQSSQPYGVFDAGMAHGITGCLNALTKAFKQGHVVENHRKGIQKIVLWLQNIKQDVAGVESVWPGTLAFNPNKPNQMELQADYYRDSWCYGSPGIAIALLQTAIVLEDHALYQYSNQALIDCTRRIKTQSNLQCISFCHGWAGLLTIFYQAYLMTKNLNFLESSYEIAKMIINRWNKSFAFGFKCLATLPQTSEEIFIDNAGMLDGVTGTALSLLNLGSKEARPWIQIFI
jgi:lantibiotic biosynthesis protein